MDTLLLNIFNDKYHRFIIDNMPDSSVKAFYKWIIEDKNSLRVDYLQKSGILKMVELYSYIFHFISKDDDKIVNLCEKISDLMIYQVYEIISDNICITSDKIVSKNKVDLNIKINNSIIEALNNTHRIKLIDIGEFDFISNHLSEDNSQFIDGYRAISKEIDIQNESWIIVYMNIISCINVINNIDLHNYKKSMIRRYNSVNHISMNKYDDIKEIIKLQSETILVSQTLQYCINIYTKIYVKNDITYKIFNDSNILSIIYDVAIVIRLLNDLGLYFLEYSLQEIEMRFDNLLNNEIMGNETWVEWFLRIALDLPFTRLYKDILFNEYNISLYNIEFEMNYRDVIYRILNNTKYLSLIYKKCMKNIESKRKYLFDNDYGYIFDIVMNMVKFHQDVYSKEYTSKEGEFAI
ncbi:hypothetical protein [Herpetosiphon gulosus]|uniref:Uncharacterized protein n=1 Tax=Herpetosiphon gulosus TaxID=1973496 RepID=A0ABP9WZ16_9CHLR